MLRFTLLCLLVASFVAVGCGDGKPPKYKLSGTVSYEGQPIPEGTIMFLASDLRGQPETAPIKDGKYALEVTAGQKKVVVEASKFVGPPDKTMGVRPRDQYLPNKYNVDTTLTKELKPQDDVYDLVLTK
jgi:hypothetical protein